MTVLELPSTRPSSPRRGAKARSDETTSSALPTDAEALRSLALELDGRPVPGVRLTEAEFERWVGEDVRAEWVDGEVVLMSPENLEQVTLGGWLFRVLSDLVEAGDLGQVIGRDFTVRLPRQRRRRCPDLLYVAKNRLRLLRPTYLDGAPDLAIEMVSADSMARDWREKYAEYERAGVREYWIFDTATRHVEAYVLGTARRPRYEPIPARDGWIRSQFIPAFAFRVDWLTLPKLPAVARAVKEMATATRGGRSRGKRNGNR